jgi:hypothetical protein
VGQEHFFLGLKGAQSFAALLADLQRLAGDFLSV